MCIPNASLTLNGLRSIIEHQFEHDIEFKYQSNSIQEAFFQIEEALNLDRKKFDYYIDWGTNSIQVYTTRAIFVKNLRDTKLSNLLDIEAL